MARIILIETSTAMCGVALAEDGAITAVRESAEPRQQSSLTAVFVDEVLKERGLRVRDCDAVCVSKGPGSYTGLRVGVSTAKGLCFGAGIPLLAVGTLDTLVWQAIAGPACGPSVGGSSSTSAGPACGTSADGLLPEGCKAIVPMIDARRMEVYSAVFSPSGERLTEIRPQVIGPDSYADLLADGPVLFIGDAAAKCSEVIGGPAPSPAATPSVSPAPSPGTTSAVITRGAATFVQCCPTASAMLRPALAAFEARRFEDLAYFEPFYLKDFIATTPRKKLF
ncbi:MAG: tRNA (adenosine(37)-N6)-threonylcarbamoyltransferase complex dimerization subunit type 1 TsaB [Bacteroidales bacterium]|nr:tRNA (adenosine(37)-N6)-threonylcarbamoyltransferase complex dimerization subunit type 1 TsaB [Bacteroidales bacterium]